MLFRFLPSFRPLLRAPLFLAIVAALLVPVVAAAQGAGQLRPLPHDPARAARPVAAARAGARVAAIALPFFDDFANARLGTRPDPTLWDSTSGVLRTETFARQAPSLGTATFDGLDRYGRAYGGGVGATDTLTSNSIDLTGRTDVVLSFWWQAGGASGDSFAPGSQSSLILDFYNATAAFWDTQVWRRTGVNATTAFEQAFVVVPARYLTGNFRFRFRARGSRQGSIDLWSVDYVLLEANRQPQPGPVRDVAFSSPLASPLQRFSAMPVWQFNAATPTPAAELTDSVRTTLTNLEPNPGANPTPLADRGWLTVTDRATGAVVAVDTFLNETRVVFAATAQRPLRAPMQVALPAAPVPATPTEKHLTTTLLLVSGELTPRTRYNDTLRARAALANYYAYDDGSPELVYSFRNTTDPVAAAVAYDLNTADQVAGVQVYLAGDIPVNTRLFVDVWADDPNRPGFPNQSMPLAHTSFFVPADTVLRRTGRWHTVSFPPVAVSGRFYAGYSQPANTVISNIGFDLSDSLRAQNKLFSRSRTDPWQAESFPGSLMVRALLNNNGALGVAPGFVRGASNVYPNPVSAAGGGQIRWAEPATQAPVLTDALGRIVGRGAVGATALSVGTLAPGVYWLRVAASGGVRVVVTD